MFRGRLHITVRENLADTDEALQKRPFPFSIRWQRLSRNIYGEEVQLTQIGSPLRFPNEPKINSVRCP